ncbi:MAG: flagellar type III secretion system protein FliR [Acidaminococcales bacterium]|jgi:flagellar biosynthetic protein FliR|nr:flagellar type III secretion system protein FliR [Acidaminococcales bacterium]
MELIQFVQQNLVFALLVFARVSGIFSTAPMFSSRNVPARIRVLSAMAITLVAIPALAQKAGAPVTDSAASYILLVFGEFIVGACIGLVMAVFFAIIQVAGQMLDTQVGFGIVHVVDPQSGTQMPLLGNFLQMLFVLVFFAADLHHLFLQALLESFDLMPVARAAFQPQMAEFVLGLFTNMFLTAFKLAMPMIITTLLVDVSMGMLARTMPQMNVFVVGIPLKLAVGVFMLSVFLPTYIFFLKVAYGEVSENIYKLLSIFAN